MTSVLSIPRSAGLGDRYRVPHGSAPLRFAWVHGVLGWDELHSVGIEPNGTLIVY